MAKRVTNMLLDDQESLKEIIRITKLIDSRKLSAILEVNPSDSDAILNLYQALIAWFIENENDPAIETPLLAKEYEQAKKLCNKDLEPSEETTEKAKRFLKDLIDKDEQKFYLAISNSVIKERVSKCSNCLNEIFVITLTSKYKSIGTETFYVVYVDNETKDELILVNDGTYYKYGLKNFINDFFGNVKDDAIFNKIYNLMIDKRKKHYDVQIELNELCKTIQEQIDTDFNLVYGAVMFCDFLGWKGLWRNGDSETLKKADTLVREINQKFIELSNQYLPLNKYFPISNLISISDTIALMTPKVHEIDNAKLFELYSSIGKFILEHSITVFPLRGAFTIGGFNYTNNIMIGPAIDEAASWHEQADWIGIILTPTAQFEYEIVKKSYKINTIAYYPGIPLKANKGSLRYCINWKEPKGAIIEAVRKNQSLPPEISNKYIYTYDFLIDPKKED